MSSEFVNKATELIRKLADLVEKYKKCENDQERFNILNEIITVRAELELLLAQYTRV